MDPGMSVALVGALVAALFGVFAGACHLLRSDLKELRTENRADLQELRTENRADHCGINARLDGLEGKVDMLILALARAGLPVDPEVPPQPPDPPS